VAFQRFQEPRQGVAFAQVDPYRQPLGMLLATLGVVPAAACAQREAAAELDLAEAPLDRQDAVAGQQRGVLLPGLGEERALDPAATVVEPHEGLRFAALAHRNHLPGDDRRRFLAPAAALLLRPRLPEAVEVAEV